MVLTSSVTRTYGASSGARIEARYTAIGGIRGVRTRMPVHRGRGRFATGARTEESPWIRLERERGEGRGRGARSVDMGGLEEVAENAHGQRGERMALSQPESTWRDRLSMVEIQC